MPEPTLAAMYADLLAPFDPAVVAVKPGAISADRTRALALAYVDARVYMARLDALAGPAGWGVTYRAHPHPPEPSIVVFCRLTILGQVREDVGESLTRETHAATSAAMQAFKRACAAFGLGRYLYQLPTVWGDYHADRRTFVHPDRIVQELYRKAGLVHTPTEAPVPTPPQPMPAVTRRAIRKGVTAVAQLPAGTDALAQFAHKQQVPLAALQHDDQLAALCVSAGQGQQLVHELRALWRELNTRGQVATVS